MTPAELIHVLRAHGVNLTVVDGAIRYRAPAGVMTPDVIAAMRTAKSQIIALLSPTPAPVVVAPAVKPQVPTVMPGQGSYLGGSLGEIVSIATTSVDVEPNPKPTPKPAAEHRDAILRTGALPAGPTVGSRLLFTASKSRAALVVVRVLSPPGSFAAVAFDPSQLLPNSFSFANPSSDVFMIPSSADAPIVRVKPGQSLYGKGSVAGVIYSISASDIDEG